MTTEPKTTFDGYDIEELPALPEGYTWVFRPKRIPRASFDAIWLDGTDKQADYELVSFGPDVYVLVNLSVGYAEAFYSLGEAVEEVERDNAVWNDAQESRESKDYEVRDEPNHPGTKTLQ